MADKTRKDHAKDIQKVFAEHSETSSLAQVQAMMTMVGDANPFCLGCHNANASQLERCNQCNTGSYYCRSKETCKKAHGVLCGK